ncbi:hypothetical protein RRG08_034493 [Elysia crispata]|uniref:Uncharacterized protein n=1 Tax=Elysia crispata TaxID=231223 RepID=A0AAE1BAQ0_9GAST|nr:hypothetical protein RRG08_034493 [Elysia crispata]
MKSPTYLLHFYFAFGQSPASRVHYRLEERSTHYRPRHRSQPCSNTGLWRVNVGAMPRRNIVPGNITAMEQPSLVGMKSQHKLVQSLDSDDAEYHEDLRLFYFRLSDPMVEKKNNKKGRGGRGASVAGLRCARLAREKRKQAGTGRKRLLENM